MESLKVNITKIDTLSELALMLDVVVKSQVDFDKRFPTDMTQIELASSVIRDFGKDSLCWGEKYEDGELKFFTQIMLNKDKTCYWTILYSHPRFRFKTKVILNQIKDYLRTLGVTTIYHKTRRVTPSYKRFMASLNSHPIEIIYKCKL